MLISMQTRLTTKCLLFIAVIFALILLPTNIVKAQSEDENSHAYCKNKAQDLTDAHFKRSDFSNTVNNAAIGAVLGRSVGNTNTGVGLGAAFGSTSNRREKKEYYQREYDSCMRNNGG